MAGSAIGLIETRGMAGVVEAADAAAKAANVELLQDTIDSNSGASRLGPLATQHPTLDTLQDMPVTRLRQLVRQTPGAGLTGRRVSRANKKELIKELQRLWQEK